jgi:hypothetical protein
MTIQLSKFNTVLNSRPSAKEAVLRIYQMINGSAEKENVVLDFADIEVLSPSYADELLQSLRNKYGAEKIEIINITPVIQETLDAIETHR